MSKLMNGNAEIIKFYCVSQINKAYNDDDIIFPSQAEPSHDYSQDYLTTKITSNGVIDYNGTTGNTISYSTDGGNTWSTPSRDARVNVQSGDTVMWKGSATTFNFTNGIGTFNGYYTSASFDVEGNIMSLIYDDDFIGETSLSGKSYAFSLLFTSTDVQNAEKLILPATYLSQYCYNGMFDGCTQLTKAPEIYGTEMEIWTCWAMFRNCTSLVKAPSILPAMTLTSNCYADMFRGCTSLTTAPELPATTLDDFSYAGMFSGCTNLNYIKMLATDVSEYACLDNWVTNVAASGTFVKNANATLPTGEDGIPSGWIVEDDGDEPEPTHDYSQDYMTFVAKSGGTFAFSGTTTANTISYSTDSGTTWSTPSTSVTINVNSGDTVLWKGNMIANNNGIGTFSNSTATFDAQGNTMSLLFGDNYNNQTSLSGKNYAFKYLFKGSKVVNSENMILPATTLSTRCYTWMFSGCTSMVTSPELPATTMAECSYGNMFEGCSSLTTAPALPATTLSSEAYSSMFQNCTSLTTAPTLPATNLVQYCYKFMFKGCTNLTTAPELLATRLDSQSYYEMFYGCSSLNYIKMLATNISASSCLANWVYGVAATGTFVKNASMTTLPTSNSGIPSGWTVQDA